MGIAVVTRARYLPLMDINRENQHAGGGVIMRCMPRQVKHRQSVFDRTGQ